MGEHTPGPWTVGHDYTIHAIDPDEPDSSWTVADAGLSCGYPDIQDGANARLIAAAPDMLAALQAPNAGARPSNWNDEDLDEGERDAWRQLDAAIAKATGHPSAPADNPPAEAGAGAEGEGL